MSLDLSHHQNDRVPRTAYSAFSSTSDERYNDGGPWAVPTFEGGDTSSTRFQTHVHVGDDSTTNYIYTNITIRLNTVLDASLIPASGELPYVWGFRACRDSPDAGLQIRSGLGERSVGGPSHLDTVPQCPEMSGDIIHQGTLQAMDMGDANAVSVSVFAWDTAEITKKAPFNIGKFVLQLGTPQETSSTAGTSNSSAATSSSTSTSSLSSSSSSTRSTTTLAPAPALHFSSGTSSSTVTFTSADSSNVLENASTGGGQSGLPPSTIALTIIGSLICLCLLIGAALFWQRRSRRNQRGPQRMSESSSIFPYQQDMSEAGHVAAWSDFSHEGYGVGVAPHPQSPPPIYPEEAGRFVPIRKERLPMFP